MIRTDTFCIFLRDNTGRATDMLLKQGADVNENFNSLLATPLHLAVVYGNDAVASRLIQSPGCDFTIKVSDLKSLIMNETG